MNIQKNINLSQYTAYETGGAAELFVEIDNTNDLDRLGELSKPLWFIGSGTNVLISDEGLPGTVIKISSSNIEFSNEEDVVIADSGVWWDDLVKTAVDNSYWGLELMSEIPGTVGAAVVGNIAAYGQAVKDTLTWVEVIDTNDLEAKVQRINAKDLGLAYRISDFQKEKLSGFVITRAAFKLHKSKTQDLEYAVAVKIAKENNLDTSNLKQRRSAIIKAREFQGSIKRRGDKTAIKTTGSFFRNPTVSEAQVDELVRHDDWGMTKDQILQQNKIHGGSTLKISAALVMLAAGYKAGQEFGNVRLHPSHVLKVENFNNATSQEIYNVTQTIIKTCEEKVGVSIEPEVRFLGKFI